MEGIKIETRQGVEVATTTTLLGRPAYWIDLNGVFWGGLISGALYLVLQMVLHPIFLGISGWVPMRRLGAIVVGQQYLTPAIFDLGIFVAALVFCCIMAVMATYLSAWVLRPITYKTAIIGGIILGGAYYVINYYMWSGLFPWLADSRNWVTFLNQIIAGFVSGLIYIGIRRQFTDRELRDREYRIPR